MKKTIIIILGFLLTVSLSAQDNVRDNGSPLQPLVLSMGTAMGRLEKHNGGAMLGYFLLDPVVSKVNSSIQQSDSLDIVCFNTNLPVRLRVYGISPHPEVAMDQFDVLLLPGETMSLELDVAACTARKNGVTADEHETPDCYRFGGTLGDLNQVLLENTEMSFGYLAETPCYQDGQTFAEWSETLWNAVELKRECLLKSTTYTRRQKDFLSLLLDDAYLRIRHEYKKYLGWRMGLEDTSILNKMDETYTLIDPHAKDLQLYHDGRTYYVTINSDRLPYLEANDLNHGEVYELLKGLADAKDMIERMGRMEILPDSVIFSAHPLLLSLLGELNDSTKLLAEELRKKGLERIKTAPEVTGDKLLEAIAAQYPGKAVFFDLWATWCGPCKRGIEAMESLKESLKERDIVFVYLTNETSPEDAWSRYVITIPGIHYRVDNMTWSQIPNTSAIPQYFLYDREGKQVWSQTGFDTHTLELIKSEIENVLK